MILLKNFIFFSLNQLVLIFVLCLFTSLNNGIVTSIVPKPSLTTYNSLEMIYSSTLRCPCANSTIPYRRFISFLPIFHQICSSGFVQNDWISVLKSSRNGGVYYDWRNRAYIQFEILSNLCQLANETIHSIIDKFLSQLFISSSIINEEDFNQQISKYFDLFYQSTIYNFDLMKDIVQLYLQVNQFHVGVPETTETYYDPALIINIITNQTNHDQKIQVKFILKTITDVNTQLNACVCATNPYCKQMGVVSDSTTLVNNNNNTHHLSGWIEGCFPFDSLLLSTFQCLYADSDCFPILLSYLFKNNSDALTLSSSSFRLQPLIYNPTMSRYPPNTMISLIIKELMIEQWNPSYSYKQFYESCAPIYCSYSRNVRKQTFLGMMTTLLSIIGGIIVSLRFLTLYLVTLIMKFVAIFQRKSSQTEQVHRTCADRFRNMIQKLMKFFHRILIEFNMFKSYNFGNRVDLVTVRFYGRWATRVFVLLYVITLTIVIFYTIIQPHSSTDNFVQPSITSYKHLKEIYGDQLKCSCSRIASIYKEFVEIQPVSHSICSSIFISEEWRIGLMNGLVSNLSIYDQRDYRRFLSAHLEYLQGLCRLSIRSVNNSVNEFHSSLLVTVELLSESQFDDRLNISIEKSQTSAPVLFSRLLLFIQSIIHGNAFISTYGTNFQYNLKSSGVLSIFVGITQALVYDDQCSCDLSPSCSTQAKFIQRNSSSIFIEGMKMGCTPSESFLVSTLECFYNQSCLDLIQQFTNYNNSSPFILNNSTRFLANTTINELIHNLFIEEWSIQRNYSSYYEQCSPSLCSYTHLEKFNVFYIVTLILGLQGGLTIVLKWICPYLIRIGTKIYSNRKRRINVVPSFENSSNMVIPNPSSISENILNRDSISSRSRLLFKRISLIVLVLCTLTGLILFSIYYVRSGTINISTMNNSNTTISTTISESSSTLKPSYQLKVKQVPFNISCPAAYLGPTLMADFNNDNRTDFIVTCSSPRLIYVLIDNSTNLFENVTIFSFAPSSRVSQILASDIDNDGRIDLIIGLLKVGSGNINIFFGNGDGTFQTQNLSLLSINAFINDIKVFDLNNDTHLDLIIVGQYDNNVYLFFYNGNRTFSSQLTLFIEIYSNPLQLAIGDFNNDSFFDIAVFNSRSLHIHLFLRNTNGTFQSQKWFYTAFDNNLFRMINGDFDNDHQSDIAFIHSWKDTDCIIYQYNNDSFRVNEQTMIESSMSLSPIVIYDINNDQHLDIIIGKPSSGTIYSFLGDGDGHFQTQTIYTNNTNVFTNDTCHNIISMNFVSNRLYILVSVC